MSEHLNNETFHGYLDGELTQSERREVEAHLRVCPTCEAEMTQLRSLFHSIESLPSEPLAIDLVPGVMAAVQPRARWLPSFAVGELVAAAALTLALVLWLGGGELQARLDGAAQRLIGQLEVAAVGISAAATDFLTQVPDSPQLDFIQLGDLIGTLFGSPSLLWAVGAIALVLLMLGNGLVLRTGKERNA
ncbi:MAG: zf-HC2 domain-containing protein [Anaerolineales bacterium]